MALVKRVNLMEHARDAVVLDLGDLRRQAELMAAQAREKAEAILNEARREREETLEGAAIDGRALGLEKGLQEGRAKGYEEGRTLALLERGDQLAALNTSWSQALAAFVAQRESLIAEATTDVLRLAALIASRVVHRTVELDPAVVRDQLRAVLGLVLRPTRVTIAVHPEDREVLEAALPDVPGVFARAAEAGATAGGAHIELVDDASLARGSCVARLGHGVPGAGAVGTGVNGAGVNGAGVNGSIRAQLDRIVSALLPGENLGEVEARIAGAAEEKAGGGGGGS